MHDDRRRWNERHDATPAPSPRAPEALERWPELASVLPRSGRGLDIACGTGAVALWLARRGLDVTALDVSDVAIGRLEAQAAVDGLSARIDARVVDLDDGLPADLVDLDLIVCQRFRDRTLYRPVIDHLAAGGLAVITVLSTVGAAEPGPFHAPADELSDAFGADERIEVLREFEGGGVAHVVARRR